MLAPGDKERKRVLKDLLIDSFMRGDAETCARCQLELEEILRRTAPELYFTRFADLDLSELVELLTAKAEELLPASFKKFRAARIRYFLAYAIRQAFDKTEINNNNIFLAVHGRAVQGNDKRIFNNAVWWNSKVANELIKVAREWKCTR